MGLPSLVAPLDIWSQFSEAAPDVPPGQSVTFDINLVKHGLVVSPQIALHPQFSHVLHRSLLAANRVLDQYEFTLRPGSYPAKGVSDLPEGDIYGTT